MDTGIAWEGIIAIASLLTTVAGIYAYGRKSGQQESKIAELERGLRMLETKVDTSLRELADRLTRMEDRLYNAFAGMQQSIRKDLRQIKSGKRVFDDENADS